MDRQKILKKIIFAGLVCVADGMLARLNEDGNLLLVFDGTEYDGRIYFYMLQFFVFACYSMYIHGEAEEYVCQTGIYLLVREGRKRLFGKISARLAGMFFSVMTIHLAGYAISCLLLNGRVYLADIKLFSYLLLVNVLVYFLILFIQMVLELWLMGRIAMYIVMLYYFASLFAGDCLYRAENLSLPCHFPFLPNIAMRLRWAKLSGFPGTAAAEIILLAGIIGACYFISRKLFDKKDIF